MLYGECICESHESPYKDATPAREHCSAFNLFSLDMWLDDHVKENKPRTVITHDIFIVESTNEALLWIIMIRDGLISGASYLASTKAPAVSIHEHQTYCSVERLLIGGLTL